MSVWVLDGSGIFLFCQFPVADSSFPIMLLVVLLLCGAAQVFIYAFHITPRVDESPLLNGAFHFISSKNSFACTSQLPPYQKRND